MHVPDEEDRILAGPTDFVEPLVADAIQRACFPVRLAPVSKGLVNFPINDGLLVPPTASAYAPVDVAESMGNLLQDPLVRELQTRLTSDGRSLTIPLGGLWRDLDVIHFRRTERSEGQAHLRLHSL